MRKPWGQHPLMTVKVLVQCVMTSEAKTEWEVYIRTWCLKKNAYLIRGTSQFALQLVLLTSLSPSLSISFSECLLFLSFSISFSIFNVSLFLSLFLSLQVLRENFEFYGKVCPLIGANSKSHKDRDGKRAITAPTNKICRRASSEQRPQTRSCHGSERLF